MCFEANSGDESLSRRATARRRDSKRASIRRENESPHTPLDLIVERTYVNACLQLPSAQVELPIDCRSAKGVGTRRQARRAESFSEKHGQQERWGHVSAVREKPHSTTRPSHVSIVEETQLRCPVLPPLTRSLLYGDQLIECTPFLAREFCSRTPCTLQTSNLDLNLGVAL